MTDELFNRLRAADPCPDAVVLQPAHSALALSLKETIMTIDVEAPAAADDAITPDRAPGAAPLGGWFGGRLRRRWLAGAGLAAAAAVAAVVVLPGPGSTGNSFAWSPIPQTTTTGDAEAARQTCTTAIDASVAEAAAAAADGSRIDAATPVAPVAAVPVELPPLTALDLRGGSGVAVFSDGATMGVCMVLAAEGGFEFGGASVFDLPAEQPTDLAVSSFMSTALGTDRAVSLVIGTAGSADRVEVSVPGLDPVIATLSDGQFAAWWPADDSAPITIRSLTADGTVVAEQSLDAATMGKVAEPTDARPAP